MATSESDLTSSAKNLDYMIRSAVSGILALGLVGALIFCAITKIDIVGQTGAALLTAMGTVIGYFFGNHAAVSGEILTSIGNPKTTTNTDNFPATK